MSAPPIVLATDFGLADAYVGMMRGVIFSINPDARVIDLTHGIGPQDVRHGAVLLADSHAYFPDGSIFVAVVDPGVGTDRPAILLETPDHRFVDRIMACSPWCAGATNPASVIRATPGRPRSRVAAGPGD